MRVVADWLEWFKEQDPMVQFNLFMAVVITFTIMLKSLCRMLCSLC